LALYGNDVTVITTTANGKVELNVEVQVPHLIEGVNVIYFKRITKDNTHFSPDLLSHLWKNINNYDVVHIHSLWNLVSVFSLIICAIKGVRPVVSPRGMLSQYVINTNHPIQKKVLHFFLGKIILSKVKFHATAAVELEEIKEVFPKSNVTVIPNIFKEIDQIKANEKPEQDDNITKILFLSRIDPKKGIEILMKGLESIQWKYHLTVVGSGPDEYLQSLKEYATQLKIEQNITWAGPIYGNEKYVLMANHNLMALTSYNENFGNVVLESLACGTPVLITDKVGLADYVQENDLGWICTTDHVSITATLDRFYTERDKQGHIRNIAPGKIRDSFSANNLAQLYINMYKS
jgi:glycosyltransferase involved in cell wall biosynthesis